MAIQHNGLTITAEDLRVPHDGGDITSGIAQAQPEVVAHLHRALGAAKSIVDLLLESFPDFDMVSLVDKMIDKTTKLRIPLAPASEQGYALAELVEHADEQQEPGFRVEVPVLERTSETKWSLRPVGDVVFGIRFAEGTQPGSGSGAIESVHVGLDEYTNGPVRNSIGVTWRATGGESGDLLVPELAGWDRQANGGVKPEQVADSLEFALNGLRMHRDVTGQAFSRAQVFAGPKPHEGVPLIIIPTPGPLASGEPAPVQG